MENERRVQQKAPAGRYALLDELRGLDLVSMMLYHACWDMMFLFGIWMDWYAGMPGRLWQQAICWVFILLSGFCVPFGRHMLRRGVTVLAAGALVTAVTLVFMPGERVIFGVLTFLGTAMLLTGVLEPLLKKVMPAVGLAVSAVLFALTYHLDERWLGFGGLRLALPDAWYANYFTAFFGFPPFDFYSTDYFALLPWLFLFWAGYFLHGVVGRARMEPLRRSVCPALGWMGRHSLLAVFAAPAGDLRRTFSRGISFCIKGLTQPGSCGILSVVRRY